MLKLKKPMLEKLTTQRQEVYKSEKKKKENCAKLRSGIL